ncbi:hypothetical protein AAC387_Pa03g0765 [Persea americana]
MGAGESKEEEKEATASEEATTALAVGASVGLAAGAIYSLLASDSSNSVSNGKPMKAPGQKGVNIPRDDCQDNLKDYLRRLSINAEKGASVGLAAGAIYSLLASGSSNSVSNGKLMKAPGQKGVNIPRDDCQDNLKDYFRRLSINAEKGASVGLAAGAIYSLLASGSSNSVSNGKLMKAPGQKGVTIRINDFEENPEDYFRRMSINAEKGASVGLAAGAIYSLLASGSSNSVSNGKLMKAPGRKGVSIRRNDFEENPKAYFSERRRGKCNENENKKMMKAPGQHGVTIRRTNFEDKPNGNFSDLRKGK